MINPVSSHRVFIRLICSSFLLKGLHSSSEDSCSAGSYRSSQPPWGNCAGYRYCEQGYFCENGVRYLCAPGHYGNEFRLNISSCSGKCSGGYFCPEGTINGNSNKCGNGSVFCPEGSSIPNLIPKGYFGIGADVDTQYDIEECPQGYYCSFGKKLICPSGTFGSSKKLHTSYCSGLCPAGWYCPLGSTSPYANACGTSPLKYCPLGSEKPLQTPAGYYALSHSNETDTTEILGIGEISTELQLQSLGGYTSVAACPRGYYCLNGMKYPCPGGSFGAITRNTNQSCSGLCSAGFYCPPGSVSNTQYPCGSSSVYCPTGSGRPRNVTLGYYTVGSTTYLYNGTNNGDLVELASLHTDQVQCEPGSYCLSDGTFSHLSSPPHCRCVRIRFCILVCPSVLLLVSFFYFRRCPDVQPA